MRARTSSLSQRYTNPWHYKRLALHSFKRLTGNALQREDLACCLFESGVKALLF